MAVITLSLRYTETDNTRHDSRYLAEEEEEEIGEGKEEEMLH